MEGLRESLSSWKVVAALVVVGGFLRLFGAFDRAEYFNEEMVLMPMVERLLATGTTNDQRATPLAGGLFVAGSVKAFGNNPVGWRAIGILFGTASILLIYLVGKELHPTGPAPTLAAALLAFDPFHVYFSRTPTPEVPVVLFFLAFIWAMVAHVERGRPTLPWAGVALGFTLAIKEYYVLAAPLVIGWALARELRRRTDRGTVAVDYAFTLGLLPAAIFLASHATWFAKGTTLGELLRLKAEVWWVSTHSLKFGHDFYLARGGPPWEWFVAPSAFGHQVAGDATHGAFLLQLNAPVFRPLVLPALSWIAVRAWRAKSALEGAAPALFAATYAVFFIVARSFYSYSSMALVPFAWLGLGHAVALLARRSGREVAVTLGFLAAVVVVGLVLFPLAAGLEVPLGLYAPILSKVQLWKGS